MPLIGNRNKNDLAITLTGKTRGNLWDRTPDVRRIPGERGIYRDMHLLKVGALGARKWSKVLVKTLHRPNHTYEIHVESSTKRNDPYLTQYTIPDHITFVVDVYERYKGGALSRIYHGVEPVSCRKIGYPGSEELILRSPAVYRRMYLKGLEALDQWMSD